MSVKAQEFLAKNAIMGYKTTDDLGGESASLAGGPTQLSNNLTAFKPAGDAGG